MNILITGSNGFIGKNLVETLNTFKDDRNKTIKNFKIDKMFCYDRDNTLDELDRYTNECDFVINLAGINRPQNPEEFYTGNIGFIEIICKYLKKNNNLCPIIISSSIQVGKDNDYAKSKKEGEDYLIEFSKKNGNPIYIYRFANLFGKWCKPNYNSVTATWCYNIANGFDIQISDYNAVISLCYIDDVISELINCLLGNPNYDSVNGYYTVNPIYVITLGELKDILYSFKNSRTNLTVPNQKDGLEKKLYATYLSYLPCNGFSYPINMKKDDRGSFTEFLKSDYSGQVSINISKPGIVKGNHWHNTKNEKFLIVSGQGIIRFRKIGDDKVIEYKVSGEVLEVIDIPTGYTHNIENVGNGDMVTVMWANEAFDPERPDTFYEEV